MTSELLRFSITPHRPPQFISIRNGNSFHFNSLPKRRRFIISKAVKSKTADKETSSVLLDVSGMMCGACVSRVKSVLSSDHRVDSVVVNMLIESAAIRLNSNSNDTDGDADVAESLAVKLTACGFPTKRRVSGTGVAQKVGKWKETVAKKEALLVESRNRVVFAWTLVALCCGSHGSHVLHSLGIHVGHGNNHNNVCF